MLYLRATLIHTVCPTIKSGATIAPAQMRAAASTSTSQLLLSMIRSIIWESCGRYGVKPDRKPKNECRSHSGHENRRAFKTPGAEISECLVGLVEWISGAIG